MSNVLESLLGNPESAVAPLLSQGSRALSSVLGFAGGRLDHIPDQQVQAVVDRLNQVLCRDGSEEEPLLTIADWRAFEQVQTEYGMGQLIRQATIHGHSNHGISVPPAALPRPPIPRISLPIPSPGPAPRGIGAPAVHAGMIFGPSASASSSALQSAEPPGEPAVRPEAESADAASDATLASSGGAQP